MPFDLSALMNDIESALGEHLPDLESYDEDMEELEDLRVKQEEFENAIEDLEQKTTELKTQYDLMLTDLIKVNLNHAILSPHEHVRNLALQVAKQMVDSQRGSNENEVLSTSAAAG